MAERQRGGGIVDLLHGFHHEEELRRELDGGMVDRALDAWYDLTPEEIVHAHPHLPSDVRQMRAALEAALFGGER